MRRYALLLVATPFLAGHAFAQEALPGAPPITTKQEWIRQAQQTISRNKAQATDAGGIGGNAVTQIKMSVLPNGAITKVEVAKPSGVPAVDAKAVEIVQRTGRLPPFLPDMEVEPLAVQVPIRFQLVVPLEERQRLYIDTFSGYRLEVPQPFSIVEARNSLPRELVLDVIKLPEKPEPETPPAKSCTIRFEAANSARETEPDAPSRLTAVIGLLKGAFGTEPGEIEKTDLLDYRGGTAVELIIKPKAPADNAGRRAFLSSFASPAGSIMMVCMTSESELASATPTFRSIRDGADITLR